jgi:trehalose 6-phosphate phosphatase
LYVFVLREEELNPPMTLLDVSLLDDAAILLDVDGTLLDIAPRPHEVQVPVTLLRTLSALSARVRGALALVSGRPLPDIDRLFSPLRLPAIGGHGAEMRLAADGEAVATCAAPLHPRLREQIIRAAERHPGVIVEDKGYSVALHYRLAPKEGLALGHDLRHICQAFGDPAVGLLSGKAVIEIKSKGFNKGLAVRELMKHPPFAGRSPIFIGDDTTDEDAFAVMPEFGGRAASVGRRIAGVRDCFESPAHVRRWLDQLTEAEVAAT